MHRYALSYEHRSLTIFLKWHMVVLDVSIELALVRTGEVEITLIVGQHLPLVPQHLLHGGHAIVPFLGIIVHS